MARRTIGGMRTQTTCQLVDAGVVADAIGVRTSTVLRWAKEGRIPAVRLSRRLAGLHVGGVLLLIFVVLSTVGWISAEHNKLALQ